MSSINIESAVGIEQLDEGGFKAHPVVRVVTGQPQLMIPIDIARQVGQDMIDACDAAIKDAEVAQDLFDEGADPFNPPGDIEAIRVKQQPDWGVGSPVSSNNTGGK